MMPRPPPLLGFGSSSDPVCLKRAVAG